jgi:Transglycosylase SLT domain/Family of unknown function (DUF5715)
MGRIVALVSVIVLTGTILALIERRNDTPVAVQPDFVPTPPPATAAPDAPAPPEPAPQETKAFEDPFSYEPGRRKDFEARAAAGNAHVLYALSPDGVIATAGRVAQFRTQIEAAADKAGVDADMLEGLVFLESAGRPDIVAPQGLEGAVGLTQILAETGQNLLGMNIDTAESARLTRKLERTTKAADIRRLTAERARVDQRFDPEQELAATGRYLSLAEKRFGSEELAFVSYHMGIGNLGDILDAYAGGPTDEPLHYAQVYFDSTPVSHVAAHDRLTALGDDSSNYLWKVRAARDIMALYRTDPTQLEATAEAQLEKNSAEELLHPSDQTEVFPGPGSLRAAYDDGELVGLPPDTRVTGLRFDPKMGAQAKRVGAPRRLYQGLRPETLALALYIGAQVRAGADDPGSALTVTSTVRDLQYQAELVKRNPEATPEYSLHTTGWAFDVLRRYSSERQALAFQATLDRLRSLNLIAYVYEPAAIHITVSSDAAAYKPLLDRVR